MTATVYILTITDQADFCNVKHHSVWSTWEGANRHAEEVVVPALIAADTSDMGDTYDRDICQMRVLS